MTCTTFDGPGNNQAGVGETTASKGHPGQTANKSLRSSRTSESIEFCNPPSSTGKPCFP